MKQLELFKDLKEREIQLRQRPATTLIPNSAYGKVTNRMKPEVGNPWATGGKPKVYHLTYTLSSRKVYIVEEPDVVVPQVRFCEGY